MNDALVDWIVQRWCEAVTAAYELARGERLNELRGSHTRLLDGRGMHPFSEAIGAAHQCQALLPLLHACELDPWKLKRQAQDDAYELFREEVIAGG